MYMNRAGSPLHRTGRGSPQASLFFQERYPSPRPVECIYFYRRPKDNKVKRLRSRLTINMNFFSDSIQCSAARTNVVSRIVMSTITVV
jgi:hypothetical protein